MSAHRGARPFWWIFLKLFVYLAAVIALIRYLLPSALDYVHHEITNRFGIEVLKLAGYAVSSTNLSFEHGKFLITKPAFKTDLTIDQFAGKFDRKSVSEKRFTDVEADKLAAVVTVFPNLARSDSPTAVASQLLVPFERLNIKNVTTSISGIPNWNKNLKLSFGLAIDPVTNNSATIKLSKLNGGIENELAVSDLNAALEVGFRDKFNIQRGSISIGAIDTGIKLSLIKSEISFSNSKLKLNKLTGQILGGTISLVPTEIDINNSFNSTFTVGVSELSIAKILELYPNERIQGDGKLKATIPVSITNKGYAVSNGTFVADGGGYLKVALPEDGGTGDLNIATRALQNLQFEKLSGSMDLAPDGKLVLSLQISGHNPEMNNEQLLNVNLKVEENLKALFKTLKISEDIESMLRGK